MERFEQGTPFQSVVITMILLNTLAMGIEADFPDASCWGSVDLAFLMFFTIEICVRLAAYRLMFFCNQDWAWNVFDFTLVGLGLASTFFIDSSGHMVTVLRTFRLLRVLRAFRIFSKFKKLRILADGLIASLHSVGWIALLFLLVMFVYAISITNLAGKRWEQFSSAEDGAVVKEKFGTIRASMETLFIFLTCDDWSTPARIVNKEFPFMQFVWVSYIVLAVFTLLSLLTGLMADKMNQVRQEAEEQQTKERAEQVAELIEGIMVVFKEADRTGDQNIDLDEFQKLILGDRLASKLRELSFPDMRSSEIKEVFDAMDTDSNGLLSLNEFRDGVLQLCKSYSPKDIMWLEGTICRVDRRLHKNQPTEPGEAWDRRLDKMHARAALLCERLKAIEGQLADFFARVGYGAE